MDKGDKINSKQNRKGDKIKIKCKENRKRLMG
jgi:hypothetical protein